MRVRSLCAAGLALGVLLAPPAAPASAKDFRPGDVRICGMKSCVAIVDQTVLVDLARFYYGGSAPAGVRAPRLGAPYFELKYSNGYVTGVAATARLDRFRSGGINMNQFNMESWYRVAARAALGLRKLAAGLKPLRVTGTTIGRWRVG
jgi:hypothetical protein